MVVHEIICRIPKADSHRPFEPSRRSEVLGIILNGWDMALTMMSKSLFRKIQLYSIDCRVLHVNEV